MKFNHKCTCGHNGLCGHCNHRSKKLLLLGAAVVLAGVALYVYTDENARENIEGLINREKAKLYVRHRLNGSDSMVKAVDNLSDAEINTLIKVADSANDIKESVSHSFEDIVDKAKNVTDTVTNRMSDFF